MHRKTLFQMPLFVLLTMQLLVCDAFAPPFNFNNPFDPQQEISLLSSFGRSYLQDGDGFADAEDVSVWSQGDRFIIAAPLHRHHSDRVVVYDSDRGSYSTLSTGDFRSEPLRSIHVTSHGGTPYLYASSWSAIHRINLDSRQAQPLWISTDRHDHRAVTTGPDGNVWTISRDDRHDEWKVMRFNASGNETGSFPLTTEVYNELNFYDSRIAVGQTRLAIRHWGGPFGNDIVFFDLSGNPVDRLVRDPGGTPEFPLIPPGVSSGYASIPSGQIAYNAGAGEFVATAPWDGWLGAQTNIIARLDGITGAFIDYVDDGDLDGSLPWYAISASDGRIYVTDRDEGRVIRTDTWDEIHRNRDPVPFEFREPVRLFVDSDRNEVYVADRRGTVHRSSFTGQNPVFFAPYGENVSIGELRSPSDVQVYSNRVLVHQWGRIHEYDLSGNYDDEFADPPGDFRQFVVVDGVIAGIGYDNRFQVHNPDTGDGEWDFNVGNRALIDRGSHDSIVLFRQSSWNGPVEIATIPASELLQDGPDVTLPVFRTFLSASSLRRSEYGDWAEIEDVSVTPQGFVWVLTHHGVLVRADMNGNVHSTRVFDRNDRYSGVASDGTGRVFVLSDRGTIQVFGPR